MREPSRRLWTALAAASALLIVLGGIAPRAALVAEPATPPPPETCPWPARVPVVAPPPVPVTPPPPAPGDKPLPINLATALKLAGARPIDIALASARVRLAVAALERARVLWLPTLLLGVDYFRHDGRIQDVQGNLFDTSKSSLLVGAGPSMVFALSDALLAPLAERQVVQAREAALQTSRNDALLAVAEAYFNVQQARGELAGAQDAARRAEDLVRRTEKLGGLLAGLEISRTRAELARRRQLVTAARERWRTASAELNRVLRLDPATLVVPLEPPHLRITLVHLNHPVDELIPLGLTNRPELAAQQALVQATLVRLRQEKLRPLIPSILIRGASTNPAGTLGGGVFGGGLNDSLNNFGARSDIDVQVLWELQNLGFGNRARVRERQAENELATLELFRIQDQVAAEVAQAYAQAVSARDRAEEAESELKDAVDSVTKNFEGLRETQRAGNVILPLVRPQEATAAVQALGQAYNDFYAAVADSDRAQFRLYRALGAPAQFLTEQYAGEPGLPMPCPLPPEAATRTPPTPATPNRPVDLPSYPDRQRRGLQRQ